VWQSNSISGKECERRCWESGQTRTAVVRPVHVDLCSHGFPSYVLGLCTQSCVCMSWCERCMSLPLATAARWLCPVPLTLGKCVAFGLLQRRTAVLGSLRYVYEGFDVLPHHTWLSLPPVASLNCLSIVPFIFHRTCGACCLQEDQTAADLALSRAQLFPLKKENARLQRDNNLLHLKVSLTFQLGMFFPCACTPRTFVTTARCPIRNGGLSAAAVEVGSATCRWKYCTFLYQREGERVQQPRNNRFRHISSCSAHAVEGSVRYATLHRRSSSLPRHPASTCEEATKNSSAPGRTQPSPLPSKPAFPSCVRCSFEPHSYPPGPRRSCPNLGATLMG